MTRIKPTPKDLLLSTDPDALSSIKLLRGGNIKILHKYNVTSKAAFMAMSEEEIFNMWKKMRLGEGRKKIVSSTAAVNGEEHEEVLSPCYGTCKYFMAAKRGVSYAKVNMKKEWDQENERIKEELVALRKEHREKMKNASKRKREDVAGVGSTVGKRAKRRKEV
eukprot:CAMPEP_0117449148 /NCGR_PEP_ID=MMETSP0759-20121206/7790_1 /TAXON_ID=63605 /ORGANISM="Percolomonas cosmopolitus, Strain WS" /LENGTH=163 /DNA_ID=CAMNT_0005241603 /DNA_START=1090 /DNA_END=1578 /DNA_ORIENTATION=+